MNGCRCRCRSCPSQNDSPATSGQVIFRFAFARFTCIRPRHARAMRWYAHCLRAPPLLHHTDANCGNLTGNGIYFSLLSNKYIEDELPVSLAVSARFDARRTQNIRQLNWKFINATHTGPVHILLHILHVTRDSFLHIYLSILRLCGLPQAR